MRASRAALLVALVAVGGIAVFAATRSSGGSHASAPTTTTLVIRSAGQLTGETDPIDGGSSSPPITEFKPHPTASVTVPPGTFTIDFSLTDNGLDPQENIAVLGYPVVFRNLTNRTLTVFFDNVDPASEPNASTPIAPGHSWAFVPRTLAARHLVVLEDPSITGSFAVEEPKQPGDTIFPAAPTSTTS
jgi:hypothetical protein